MSKTSTEIQKQALTAIRRQMNELQKRIEADSNALQKLQRAATLLTAELEVASSSFGLSPEWKRNCLIMSSQPTNAVPRKPVVQQ